MPNGRTRYSSRAGIAPPSRAACSSPRPPSRRDSSPVPIPMPTSTTLSHNSTRLWVTRWLASLLVVAGCAGGAQPAVVTPGTEPEVRIGLVAGALSVTLGGDGELFVTDDTNGQPIGSIPAGVTWTVVPDTVEIGRAHV